MSRSRRSSWGRRWRREPIKKPMDQQKIPMMSQSMTPNMADFRKRSFHFVTELNDERLLPSSRLEEMRNGEENGYDNQKAEFHTLRRSPSPRRQEP